ncbi:hypothetical protein PQR15_33360 [Streptomyces lydicus]|nr:hypothetical protein [Streptomyces lydicus]
MSTLALMPCWKLQPRPSPRANSAATWRFVSTVSGPTRNAVPSQSRLRCPLSSTRPTRAKDSRIASRWPSSTAQSPCCGAKSCCCTRIAGRPSSSTMASMPKDSSSLISSARPSASFSSPVTPADSTRVRSCWANCAICPAGSSSAGNSSSDSGISQESPSRTRAATSRRSEKTCSGPAATGDPLLLCISPSSDAR